MDNKRDIKEKRGADILKELRLSVKKRRGRGVFLLDAAMLLVAFLFSRCHLLFGAYPLGLVLVSSASHRVIIIAIGAVLGSLTLGPVGYISALLIPLAVCLRVLLGGSDSPTFSEHYVARVASLSISAALGGLYEILTNGFVLSSVLYASCEVVLSVGISLALCGIFTCDISARELLFSKSCRISEKNGKEKRSLGWSFALSFLVFVFLISFSLREYTFFGITFSLCFSTLITLAVGVRLGVAAATVVGFMSGLASGAMYAVSFALAGAVSSVLYAVGIGYAIVGGGIVLSLWAAFVNGISGFLSILPEYGSTALIAIPALRLLSPTADADDTEHPPSCAREMVITASARENSTDSELVASLEGLANAMRLFSEGESGLEFEEYRNIVIALTAGLCDTPCEENVDALASKLYKGDRPDVDCLVRLFGDGGARIYHELMRLVGEAERECYISAGAEGVIGEYEHIGRMLMHYRYKRDRDSAPDCKLADQLSDKLRSLGFRDGEAAALGMRRTCVIAAAVDSEGKNIGSAEVRSALEECVGKPLSDYEYYKKDNTSLIKCYTAPKYEIEYAVASCASCRTGVSGDTSCGFESDGNFYSLISDGMGSGERARRTSCFVSDYLRCTMIPDTPTLKEGVATLSSLLRRGRDECAATVDVFSFDLYTGEARFLKCGAAPS